MTETEAISALTRAFEAKVVSLSDIVRVRDLDAEMHRDLDDAGYYDEQWWLDMDEH